MARPLSAKWSVELGFRFPTKVGDELQRHRLQVMNDDMDGLFIIDGDEGVGKSHTAQQIAQFLDVSAYEEVGNHPTTGKPLLVPTERDFTVDQIVFTKQDFIEQVRKLPKYKCVVFDESGRDTDRRKPLDNTDFNQMFREAREHNKFMILVHQSFYDMDMQLAVRRSRGLFHFYEKIDIKNERGMPTKDGFSLSPTMKGFCRLYNRKAKQEMYVTKWMRQKYYYPPSRGEWAKNSFEVQFGYHWHISEEAYKEKKRDAVLNRKKVKAKNIEGVDDPERCPRCGKKQRWVNMTEGYRACICGNKWPLESGDFK